MDIDYEYKIYAVDINLEKKLINFDPELVLRRNNIVVLVYAGMHRSKNFFELLCRYAEKNDTLILKYKNGFTYIEAPLRLIEKFANKNPPLHLK
jgi:hypothetical protein